MPACGLHLKHSGHLHAHFGILCLQSAQQMGRWPPNHPLAWLQEEQDDITEDRRRELIEHGFPGKLVVL